MVCHAVMKKKNSLIYRMYNEAGNMAWLNVYFHHSEYKYWLTIEMNLYILVHLIRLHVTAAAVKRRRVKFVVHSLPSLI